MPCHACINGMTESERDDTWCILIKSRAIHDSGGERKLETWKKTSKQASEQVFSFSFFWSFSPFLDHQSISQSGQFTTPPIHSYRGGAAVCNTILGYRCRYAGGRTGTGKGKGKGPFFLISVI